MRIALCGYYGFGNTGDEAVLSATLTELRRRLPAAESVVLSADPPATRDMHGVHARPRWPLPRLRAAIRSSDLLLSGGGSLLQDATSLRSLAYYLLTLQLARWCGVPYVIHAQGIGPLGNAVSRWAAARYLRKAVAVTVRDRGSAELAERMGVAPEALTLAADPALLLEPASASEAEALLSEAGVNCETPLVGMVVREWRGAHQALPELARVGRMALEGWGARVVVLPLQLPDDAEVSHELAALLPDAVLLERRMHPRTLMAIVGRMQMLVAMRLHALVFAAAQGVAAVGLSYDPKVEALCEAAGQPWVPLTSPREFASVAERTWLRREETAARRGERARVLRERAARAFDVIERVAAQIT